MKQDIHPEYGSVAFWTGKGRVMDTEGRVEAFERRYGRHEEATR